MNSLSKEMFQNISDHNNKYLKSRGTGAINARKKRMKKFIETEQKAAQGQQQSEIICLDDHENQFAGLRKRSNEDQLHVSGKLEREIQIDSQINKINNYSSSLVNFDDDVVIQFESKKQKRFESAQTQDDLISFDLVQYSQNDKLHQKKLVNIEKQNRSFQNSRLLNERKTGSSSWLESLKKQATADEIEKQNDQNLIGSKKFMNFDSRNISKPKENEPSKQQSQIFFGTQPQNSSSALTEQKLFQKTNIENDKKSPETKVHEIERSKIETNKYKIEFKPINDQKTDENEKVKQNDLIELPKDLQNLKRLAGNPIQNIVKGIHGVRVCEITGQILYLCSWEQDYVHYFYQPSWVLRQMLIQPIFQPSFTDSSINGQTNNSFMNYDSLIREFYEYFLIDSAQENSDYALCKMK